jgi:hypothetical protein
MHIFKVFQIEAAHRLPNVPAGHKCARLHGHSFRIEIHVAGEPDSLLGWVMDFADVKAAFGALDLATAATASGRIGQSRGARDLHLGGQLQSRQLLTRRRNA